MESADGTVPLCCGCFPWNLKRKKVFLPSRQRNYSSGCFNWIRKRKKAEKEKLKQALWSTKKQLEDTKPEMEEIKKNFKDPLKRGVGNLCGSHTEEEGMKASIPNENFRLDSSSSSKQQQGEPEETEDRKLSLDNFEFIKKLGEGGFGLVFLAKGRLPDGPNKKYAIKALKKKEITSSTICYIFTEKEALKISSGCPFVTTLYACFQNKDHLFLVMDYLSKGDLWDQLQKVEVFSQKKTQFYSAEIVLALQYIHKRGIIHRDLKLSSVLLGSDGHCKVADFGLSKINFFAKDRTHSCCGTPQYMAPEMLMDLPYGHSVDWWALGIMIFEMLTGNPPYDCDNSTDGDGEEEKDEEEEEKEKEAEEEEREAQEEEVDDDDDDSDDEEDQKLYNKIITKEVNFPADLSPAAASLVSKLWLRIHPIDWGLMAQQTPSGSNPSLKG